MFAIFVSFDEDYGYSILFVMLMIPWNLAAKQGRRRNDQSMQDLDFMYRISQYPRYGNKSYSHLQLFTVENHKNANFASRCMCHPPLA